MPTELTKSRPTLLVLDLEPLELGEGQARIISQLVVDAYIKSERFAIITQQDIQRVVDLEASKQTVGCNDESCLSEIAGAMNARYIVYGTVGVLGRETIVQLNLFDAMKSEAKERHTVRVTDVGELSEKLDEVIAGMAPEVPGGALKNSALFATGVGVAGAGALAVVIGAAGGAIADSALADPRNERVSKSTAVAASPWLWGLGVAGGAMIVGGGVMVLLGLPEGGDE